MEKMKFPKVHISAAERKLLHPFFSVNAIFVMKLVRVLPTQYLIYANDCESIEFAEIVGHTGMVFQEPWVKFCIATELKTARQAISEESYLTALYPEVLEFRNFRFSGLRE